MIFFEPEEVNSDICTARFTATDGASVLGICDLLVHNGVADLVSLRLDTPELSIGEGLIRAALHYAANRGIYLAVYSAKGVDAVRSRMAFCLQNGQWRNDIPTLLMGSCAGH